MKDAFFFWGAGMVVLGLISMFIPLAVVGGVLVFLSFGMAGHEDVQAKVEQKIATGELDKGMGCMAQVMIAIVVFLILFSILFLTYYGIENPELLP